MSISRDDVCVGHVQKYYPTDKFYIPEVSRSILFVPNGVVAEDLLYNSPRYQLHESPIDFGDGYGMIEEPEIDNSYEGFGLSSGKIRWCDRILTERNFDKGTIMVGDSYNLALLLEYFGYPDNLSYDDIIKIRKTLFDGRFPIENCYEFGYESDILGNFHYVKETPLSGYWEVLKDYGNVNCNYNLLGWEIPIVYDAFRPNKGIEGHIKKRSPFAELRKR